MEDFLREDSGASTAFRKRRVLQRSVLQRSVFLCSRVRGARPTTNPPRSPALRVQRAAHASSFAPKPALHSAA